MYNLDEFSDHLKYELNRSPHTIRAYEADINEFINFYLGSGDMEAFEPRYVSTPDIRVWLADLAQKDSARTIRRKTQSLRAFFKFLLRKKIVDINPADSIVLAKTSKPLPQFVRQEEMENLLDEMKSISSDDGVRDVIILTVLYTTGIRRAELTGLKIKDFDGAMRTLKITGKRNKQRIVPLAEELCDDIQDYIATVRAASQPEHDFLFDNKGKPLSTSKLYRIVNDSLAGTGVQKRSPHVLRHTFATSMLNNGAGLDAVKEFLGHESLSTTQIYTHVSFSEMKQAYRKAHPRSKKNKL